MEVRRAVIEDALHGGVVQEPGVRLAAEVGHGLPFRSGQNSAARHRRAHHQHDARPAFAGGAERVHVEAPAAPLGPIRHQHRRAAGDPDAVEQPDVDRIGRDHGVAGFEEREQGRQDAAEAARGDEAGSPPIVVEPGQGTDVRGRGPAQDVGPEERQIAVRVVLVHRAPRRLEGGGGRAEVRVEVLEAQHGGIGQRVGLIAHPVDADARHAAEPAHRRVWRSRGGRGGATEVSGVGGHRGPPVTRDTTVDLSCPASAHRDAVEPWRVGRTRRRPAGHPRPLDR